MNNVVNYGRGYHALLGNLYPKEKVSVTKEHPSQNVVNVLDLLGMLLDLRIGKREVKILELRFGLNSRERCFTLGEISEKMNLSRERVRQLQERTLLRLRRALWKIGQITQVQISGTNGNVSILERPIEVLGLSTRAYNALKGAGITMTGELVQKSALELWCIRGFGNVSVNDVKKCLERISLSLKIDGMEDKI